MSTLLASPVPAFIYMRASAPDAPPFSETTIGCFISPFFWMAACIMRAIWSEAPPAPAATTISTGLVGSHAACAGALANRSASAPPSPDTDIALSMTFLPRLRLLFQIIIYQAHQTARDKTRDTRRWYKASYPNDAARGCDKR